MTLIRSINRSAVSRAWRLSCTSVSSRSAAGELKKPFVFGIQYDVWSLYCFSQCLHNTDERNKEASYISRLWRLSWDSVSCAGKLKVPLTYSIPYKMCDICIVFTLYWGRRRWVPADMSCCYKLRTRLPLLYCHGPLIGGHLYLLTAINSKDVLFYKFHLMITMKRGTVLRMRCPQDHSSGK